MKKDAPFYLYPLTSLTELMKLKEKQDIDSETSKKYVKLDLYKNQFTRDGIKALTYLMVNVQGYAYAEGGGERFGDRGARIRVRSRRRG